MERNAFSALAFQSNIEFNGAQKAQRGVSPTRLCILLPKFSRFSKAGIDLLRVVQRVLLRFAAGLNPPFSIVDR